MTTSPSSSSATSPASSLSRRRYLIFAVVGLALLMSSIDSTIVAVGLHTIMNEFHTSLAWVAWTLIGFQLASTIILPLAGKLSDEFGRKRIFVGAIILFTASSIAAGFAPNIYFLIVCRVLQGIGGGAFMPSATGIISDAFVDRRATAIGLFASIFPIGGIIGPNIGGFIIDHVSWRWIFFVNGPIGLLLLVSALSILPSSRSAVARRAIDAIGVALFAVSMFLVLYSLLAWGNEAQSGAGLITWLFLSLGLALLLAFLWRESHTDSPLIDLELLKKRPFMAINTYAMVQGSVIFGISSFIPLYAVLAYGMSASESGFILTPRSITMILVSAIASFLIIRSGYRAPMVIGILLLSLSLLLLGLGLHDLSVFGLHIPDIALLSVIVALSGAATGLTFPASNNANLDLAPGKIAAISALRSMFRSIGGIIGGALIVLFLSHYSDQGEGLQHIFLFLSIMLLAIIPVVLLIPDTARQRRRESLARQAAAEAPAKSSS
jgi:EmrB/QacA subfamily drug resistance transporter